MPLLRVQVKGGHERFSAPPPHGWVRVTDATPGSGVRHTSEPNTEDTVHKSAEGDEHVEFARRHWSVSLAAIAILVAPLSPGLRAQPPRHRSNAVDVESNGLLSTSQFRKARKRFEHQVTEREGLGPVFTARSCATCHGQPTTGGGSQVTHVSVGHVHPVPGFEGATMELGIGLPFPGGVFGGFLWPRAICSDAQMRVPEPGTQEPIRATNAPSRDETLAPTPDALDGEQLFATAGCSTCRVPTFQTAAPGTLINGGLFEVPAALGNKTIHPYSDFLLHDIGTGGGAVSVGSSPSTANKFRTSPLWGLRFRNRLMHDGGSHTLAEAIDRHDGEAGGTKAMFNGFTATQQSQLFAFLKSL
ncbi:MAG TPA: hypothetical protein EYQ83_05730 [Acidobacteria bacterium]|nr:hypothetical protein [Acidobacteriota bacterium]